MIRAILYDAVGTLIHVKPSVGAIYAEVGKRFGSRVSLHDVYRRFPAAFARQDRIDELACWRTDEARERERWRAIVREVLDDVAHPAECFDVLFNIFSDTKAWTIDIGLGDMLLTIQQRGIRQAVASNFDGRLHGILRAASSLRHLDPVFVSSEIGWRKPAPEFFAHIFDSLQLSPGEILFVGDDRANDYDAAKRAGMRSVLLDPGRRHLDLGADRIDALHEVVTRV
jgi:putative hydrolase of the HAD superfamily